MAIALFGTSCGDGGSIGTAGQDAAHGEAGFRSFSHLRPVLQNRLLPIYLLMPPYGKRARRLVDALLRWM